MAKNKKRRIIVVAALCCAMLLLFFPIVYSPPAETAYLSSEPWAKEVKFVGWDYVRYNYYLYRNIMLGYPWVVRMAYTIVFFCCVATFLLFIAMAWDVYRRRKMDRKNERLRKRYYDKIMELARMDHSLSIPEIKSAIEYKKRDWSFEEYRLWAYMLIDIRSENGVTEAGLVNLRRTVQLIGLQSFIEDGLMSGKRKNKVRFIQAARLLRINLPDSIMARLVNDRDMSLRKAARLYYMLANKDDPYAFFENDTLETEFTAWDKVELHQLFSNLRAADRALPALVPMIERATNPEMGSFLIRETAYWGNEADVRNLMQYFTSKEMAYREASFVGLGLRRFSEAERAMQHEFFNQTEYLRRVILNALLEIRTGMAINFFVNAYYFSTSYYTKRTALRCLWLYGPEAQMRFSQLKNEASPDMLILFEHVENPIINHDDV